MPLFPAKGEPKSKDLRPEYEIQKIKAPPVLIKLFQEAYVVFEKQTDVIEAVHQIAHAVDS